MASGYKFTYNNATVDLSDVYMEKQYFSFNSILMWGGNSGNSYGGDWMGVGDYFSRSSPVQTILGLGQDWRKISVGSSPGNILGPIKSTYAIRGDRKLFAWTKVGYGYGAIRDWYMLNEGPWDSVSGGMNFGSGIKTDGTLWSWGYGYNGQLGHGIAGSVDYFSPVETVAGGNNWKQVSCADYSTAAIKTDGTLWLWGLNYPYGGILGDNTTTDRSSPAQTVSGGNNWKQVSHAGMTSAAIKTDGTLWTWGRNSYGYDGALGDNSATSRSSPVQTIIGGTNWREVSNGGICMAAIKTDGTLWTWGINSNGQLGDGTTENRSSPVQIITGGTDWKQVSCSTNHMAAIKTDGTLWAWGYNGATVYGDVIGGQLGDNTMESRSSPVQVVSDRTWATVVAKAGITVALSN
jgi:alpha-tubulin suppressor-like RCC1 family protein